MEGVNVLTNNQENPHWGETAISAIVLVAFVGLTGGVVFGTVKLDLAPALVGIMAAAFLLVVFSWVGSRRNARLNQSPSPTPPPTPPEGQPTAPPKVQLPTPIPPAPSPPATPAGPVAPSVSASDVLTFTGPTSTFGGIHDMGVGPDEGLSLVERSEMHLYAPDNIFLPASPPGTTGLARQLNEDSLYCAMRWDWTKTPRAWLQHVYVLVSCKGKTIKVRPVDYGPGRTAVTMSRIIDLSPGAAKALGVTTDVDNVTVVVPLPSTHAAATTASAAGEPPWMTLARAEIGFHETGDNQGIQRYVDLAGYGANGEPWCAIFAGAMLKKAGINITGCTAMARSFSSAPSMTKIAAWRPGCIAVFWRGSQSGTEGHVGFAATESATTVQTLGGNEDDQVEIESISKSSGSMGLIGYYWPTSAAPAEPKLT